MASTPPATSKSDIQVALSSHDEPHHYGSRLLPQVVDELASSNPTRVYATIPVSPDLSQGFRDVTVLDIAKAVNAFAWWLEERIGKSSSFETLAYMGIPDLRYAVVFLAAVKCGYKVGGHQSPWRWTHGL